MKAAKDAFGWRAGDILDGRYRIAAVLGRGAFGAVYAAVHLGTGQDVAIKLLTTASAPGAADEHRARFQREARITAQLQHPHTVRVFDTGHAGAGGPPYLVMERLHGPTLEAVLAALGQRDRTMSEVAALHLALPILGSLAEAHGRGLVHRDLKPANLLIAEVPGNDPVVKVLDFGCSSTADSELTREGAVFGTPGYMSPEQGHGEEVDGRSDLYSLGVILYRCVCGRLPFSGPDPLTMMYQHAHAALPDPIALTQGRMSRAFADVLQRALAKSPADRYQSAAEMRTALERLRGELQPAPGHASGITLMGGSASPPLGPLASLVAVARGQEVAPGSDGWTVWAREAGDGATSPPPGGAHQQAEGRGSDAAPRDAAPVPSPAPTSTGPGHAINATSLPWVAVALALAAAVGALAWRLGASSAQRSPPEAPGPVVAAVAPRQPAAAIGALGPAVVVADAARGGASATVGDSHAPAAPLGASATATVRPQEPSAADAAAELARRAAASQDMGERVALLQAALRLQPDQPAWREALRLAQSTEAGGARPRPATERRRTDRTGTAPPSQRPRSRVPQALMED